ncbi:MAG: hypothetical protein ACR2PZ_07250 [Pseudomonadales bacterium]
MAEAAASSNQIPRQAEAAKREGPKPRRVPKLSSLLLTDLAGALAALTLWGAADLWYQLTALPLAGVVVVGDALFVGYLLNALMHEWGHYLGAVASGAHTTLIKPSGFSLFRFKFRFEQSGPRQFVWMSVGGNLAHWAVVGLLYAALPLTTVGQLALLAAAFGFAVSATIFELPVLLRVRSGSDPEATLTARATRETFRRGRLFAAAGGALLFAALH